MPETSDAPRQKENNMASFDQRGHMRKCHVPITEKLIKRKWILYNFQKILYSKSHFYRGLNKSNWWVCATSQSLPWITGTSLSYISILTIISDQIHLFHSFIRCNALIKLYPNRTEISARSEPVVFIPQSSSINDNTQHYFAKWGQLTCITQCHCASSLTFAKHRCFKFIGPYTMQILQCLRCGLYPTFHLNIFTLCFHQGAEELQSTNNRPTSVQVQFPNDRDGKLSVSALHDWH